MALQSIYNIIRKYEGIDLYVQDIKKFFIKNDEETYLKVIRIKLMEINTRKSNFGEIVNEFTQYLMDPLIMKETMEAMDKLIMRFEQN